jgi:hypothetical protein
MSVRKVLSLVAASAGLVVLLVVLGDARDDIRKALGKVYRAASVGPRAVWDDELDRFLGLRDDDD